MSSKHPSALAGRAPKEFTYPALPGAGDAPGTAKSVWTNPGKASHAADGNGNEEREKLARKKGFEDGLASARAAYEREVATVRAELGKALRDFATERERYFHNVEQEVVRLALAIVRKIIHRESQIDPLILTGVVRVALEKANSGTRTALRVHPSEAERWRQFFVQDAHRTPPPEVVEDVQVAHSSCVLETEVGTSEIGLETHLREIEQGFLDLLAQRPGAH